MIGYCIGNSVTHTLYVRIGHLTLLAQLYANSVIGSTASQELLIPINW